MAVTQLKVLACGLTMLATLLAGGCTKAPEPAPSPSPSPTAVTSPSPTPTENAQERQQRLDFEAARKAYLRSSAEIDRLMMAGGAAKPTAILKQTTGGFHLKAMMNALRTVKKNGWRTDRSVLPTVVADDGWSPNELSFTACEDLTKVRFLNNKGKEVLGDRDRLYVHTLTATKNHGIWKITDGESRAVKSFSHGVCEP